MGITRSKPRGHDLLNEFDEAYFDKLTERFKTSSQTSKPNRFFGCFTSVTKKLQGDVEESDGQEKVVAEAQPLAPSSILPAPGPLQNTTLQIPTPKKKKNRRKRRVKTDTSKSHSIRHIRKPMSNQSSCSTAYYINGKDGKDTAVIGRDSAEEVDITVSDDSFLNDILSDILSPSSSPNSRTKTLNRNLDETHEIFDSAFNTGVLWDSLKLESQISVCKFSSCFNQQTDSFSSFFLAIGCDDGALVIAEIVDDTYRQTHSPMRSKTRIISKLKQDSRIRTMDFSPCSRFLMIAGDDCTINIFSIIVSATTNGSQDASILKLIEIEREDRIYAAAWSPSGKYVSIGGFDGTLALYVFKHQAIETTLHLILELPCNCLILSVAWSPDSSALAVGGSDKTVSLFEVTHSDGKTDSILLTKISEIRRTASVSCLKWNYDGSSLAIATQDGSVVIFSIASDSSLKEIYRPTSTGLRFCSLCFSPDGLFLAVGGCDSKCVLIEMESHTIVQEIRRAGPVKTIDWVYWPCLLDSSPSKCILAVGGEDATMALLKTGTDDDLSSQYSSDASDCDSTDGSTIVSALSANTNDWIFDECSFENSMINDVKTNELESSDSIVSVAFVVGENDCASPVLVIAFRDGRLDLITTDNGTVIKTMALSNTIKDVRVSPDGQFIAILFPDEINFLSIISWEKIYVLCRPSVSLCWSPASDRLLIGTDDGIVTILDSHGSTFKVRGELDSGKDSPASCLDCSREYIAVGREDSTVSVYNAEDTYEEFFFTQSEVFSRLLSFPAQFVKFSSDGKIFVVAAKSIYVHSAIDKWAILREVPTPFVTSHLCFSFSFRGILAIANLSTAIMIYNCYETQTAVQEIELNCDRVRSISFNHDGSLMAVACNQGVVRIFDCQSWKTTSDEIYLQAFVLK